MNFLVLLILYTIFVLSAGCAASKIWHFAHEQGIGALVIRVPPVRNVGWDAISNGPSYAARDEQAAGT